MVEVMSGLLIAPTLKYVDGFVIYLAVVLWRPQGPVRPLLMAPALRWGLGALACRRAPRGALVSPQPYPRHVFISIFLYSTLAQAWNLLAGYCGRSPSGTRCSSAPAPIPPACSGRSLGSQPWAGSGTRGAGGGAVAADRLTPCFALRGHYLAIATIAVGEIVQTLMLNWD
jgi:branched-chain amino acid transport system permease protein